MKTGSTQTLQFSGYPPQAAEAGNNENSPCLSLIQKENKSAVPEKATLLVNVPENWDESWFANYE